MKRSGQKGKQPMIRKNRLNEIHIENASSLLTARHMVREASAQMGFSLVDQTRLITAVSELTRNAVMYAGSGKMDLDRVEDGSRRGLMVKITDRGPGIEDISQAMQDGYTTSRGLGNGLGGSKRLVDDFSISSTAGEGTEVVIVKWQR